MRRVSIAIVSATLLSGACAPSTSQLPSSISPGASAAAVSLKQDMRKLWTDHVVWTRDYIVAATTNQADQQAAAGRLM
jgi:hypothetical protein